MLSNLIPYLSKHEKELAILDVIKNAEKEKPKLGIAIYGQVDKWIYDWIAKREHKISKEKAVLAIFIDQKLDEKALIKYKRQYASIAVIAPSEEIKKLPKFLNKKISAEPFSDQITEKNDGKINDFFYGLWNAHLFGFKETKFNRYEFTAAIWVAAFLILLVSFSHPVDDLLRHTKAYKYDYDYSKMFAYSWNFSFNPYLLFDQFAGLIDQNFGEFGLKIIQLLCFTVFSIGFFLHTKDWDDKFRALVFVLVLSIVIQRIVLARPTVFEAFLFIIGLTLSGLPAVLFGVFMGSFYYLFPIFLIPLVFVRKEYAISLVISLILWLNYAGADYFSDIYYFIFSIVNNREMIILENQSILQGLFYPEVLLLIFLFIRSKNFIYLPIIVYFLLFNQIRYVEILAPLLVISLREKNIGIDKIRFKPLESLFLLFILIAYLNQIMPFHIMKNINIQNATVMCDTMQCMFNTVYESENITISPSMELGLTEREVQLQMKNIFNNGTLDCEFFKKYPYDYLVEDKLKEIPNCLELADVESGYRIWKIKR